MTYLDLPTIALLLIIIANIGTLLILKQMRRDKHHLHVDTLDVEMVVDERAQGLFDDFRALVKSEGKLTRERIAQTKTRLADEEKADQKARAAARRKKAKA